MIFASAELASGETLARVVGKDCSIDLLIGNLHEELSSRPYELGLVAGGRQHRTPAVVCRNNPRFFGADAERGAALSEFEAMVLMAVGYSQPVARGELSKIFGKEVSRDTRRWVYFVWTPHSDARSALQPCDHSISPLRIRTGDAA